jgi:hypothetical protein
MLLVLVLALGTWIVPAVLVARLAERRGRSFAVYVAFGLLVSWLIALVTVLVFPSHGEASHPSARTAS